MRLTKTVLQVVRLRRLGHQAEAIKMEMLRERAVG
jgi:hypothetical protein